LSHPVHVNPLLFEAGDRMSRDEFIAAWSRMPGVKFAELIEDTVYMPSPLSHTHSF
jgi:hypothetical protein